MIRKALVKSRPKAANYGQILKKVLSSQSKPTYLAIDYISVPGLTSRKSTGVAMLILK
jgi:hypothetical protein